MKKQYTNYSLKNDTLSPLNFRATKTDFSEINLRPNILRSRSLHGVPELVKEDMANARRTPNLQVDKKCQVITTLCLVNLVANSAYSSIAPFFP